MVRRFQTQLPFNPDYDFACHKPFTYDGVDYQSGDAFPGKHKVTKPAASLLEKLYRQNRITSAAPAKDVMQQRAEKKAADAARKAAARARQEAAHAERRKAEQAAAQAALDAKKAAAADGGESGQGGASTDASNPENTNAESTQPQGDADGNGGAGRAVVGAGADAAAGGSDGVLKPVGPLRAHHDGFQKYSVIAENGVVVASDLSKAEAKAKAEAGL